MDNEEEHGNQYNGLNRVKGLDFWGLASPFAVSIKLPQPYPRRSARCMNSIRRRASDFAP